MKKLISHKLFKIASVVLAAMLVTVCVAGSVYAGSVQNVVSGDASVLEDTISDVIELNSDSSSDDKEETVYVITDPSGNIEETIISDWLKNPDGAGTLEDYSELEDIEINTGSLADLNDSLDDLEDAASDLVDGASDLYAGSEDLESGVGDLLDGTKALSDGASEVNDGAADLRDGLKTLSQNSDTLNSGAEQIVDAIFDTATTQLREELVASGLMTESEAADITLTRSNYVSVFEQLSDAVTVTPEEVEAQIRAELSAMTTDQQSLAITIAYDLMAADSGLDYTDAIEQAAQLMTEAATIQTVCSAIDADWITAHMGVINPIMTATGANLETAAKLAAVALYLGSADPTGQLGNAESMLQNAATVASAAADDYKITALCTAVASAASSTGNDALDAVRDQLDDIVTFYNGLLSYTNGVDSAYAGSQQLAEGTSSLQDGAEDLYDGVYTLYAGSKQLASGAGDLKDGCGELKDGMSEFYDEGIEKLIDALDGDYQDLADRLEAVADAGRNYQNFSGISGDMKGSVKFIYRTDSIGE